jgi:CheY-like chemotaxis protein
VDDNAGFLETLAHHLGGQGYKVLTAHSGLAALNQARASLPDLILLAVVLPGLDGLTVCQLLHLQPSTRDIPVILYTAQRGEAIRADCARVGATEFLLQPFSLETLSERVRRIRPPGLERHGPAVWSAAEGLAGTQWAAASPALRASPCSG